MANSVDPDLGSCCSLLFIIKFVSNAHHHHSLSDLGAGASSTSVGPFPGNWLAARKADLTPDLQVLLS